MDAKQSAGGAIHGLHVLTQSVGFGSMAEAERSVSSDGFLFWLDVFIYRRYRNLSEDAVSGSHLLAISSIPKTTYAN
ncbi:hypothetical protein NZK35_12080 [Stieleria sp. ICT_E10.1]|uniref:hypothetical protein n=1 Tax=Stieleria sedimenti TaxID=2976331 RepID=UPI00217F73AA|nr:hypothetical protein [Stieleria sedimenti]MCS7467383.1 hypothetical protein [Stieleria sedimenti]